MLVGSLAVPAAGGSMAGSSAQGPPRLIFASDRAPDYYPEVYSVALAGGVPQDVSRDEHSDELAAEGGRQIVFASDRDGKALYTASLGASDAPRRFTDLPSHSLLVGAAWSPNRAALAVTVGSTLNTEAVVDLVDRSGRKLAQMRNAGGRPLWSADGTRLAYSLGGVRLRRPTIRITDARGRVLFSRPGSSAFWASSAPRLAIVSPGGDATKGSTIVTDEQGRTIRRITGEALALSPDGETLVLVRRPQGLWLASVQTGRLRQLPSGEPANAAVSPDGRHLELQFSTQRPVLVLSMSSGRVESRLPAFGTWLGDSRRLAAVIANRANLMAVNGRVLRRIQLGPAGAMVSGLTVTQDGTSLVYTMQGEHVHQLYELLPAGKLRPITTGHMDHSSPASSPDGRLIADSEFATPCGNCIPSGIGILPADGSAPARELPGGQIDTHPTWSADGARIAYARADSTGSRIVVAPADGSRPPLELKGGADGREPTWAPDGSAIAATRGGIFLMKSDGTGLQQLTRAVPAGSGGSPAHAPSWSPDSRTIAFAGGDGLYLIGRDGRGLHRILAAPGIASVSWSPDGALIALAVLCAKCTASETHDIWTVRPDGSDLTNVAGGVADDTTPAWLPASS